MTIINTPMHTLNQYIWYAIAIDVGLLITEVAYFSLVTKFPETTYICDLLFNSLSYRMIVTVLVFLQIFTTCVYAFSRRKQHPREYVYDMAVMIITGIGWGCVFFFISTADHNFDRYGTGQHKAELYSPLLHAIGAKLFIYGHVACVLCITWDAAQRFQKSRTCWHFCMVMAIVVLVFFCGVFSVLNALQTHYDWVYEHLLFISFIIAHMLFFINTLQDVHDSVEYPCEFNMLSSVRISHYIT